MIEFSGCLSYKCQKYILQKESKIGLISGLITAVIFAIPIIIFAVKANWIFIIFIPVLMIFALLAGMPPSPKNYSTIMPSKITINTDNDTIISESDKFRLERSITDVVSVNDMGEWYHIYFGEKIDKLGRFVCQKDLICNGTLDKFEQIFNGKIKSKI